MKTVWTIVLVTIVLCLTSCKSSSSISSTPTVGINTSQPLLKTAMGDFVIVSARLVDEVHGDEAPAGEKFLLLILARPGLVELVPGEFSLEAFISMISDGNNEIYILGNDGSQTFSTGMSGWDQDEFLIGFRVPFVEAYTLYWPGNVPIDLNIEQ